jgi:predicted AAA+ superfamily ATPase
MIERRIRRQLIESIRHNPAVGLLGPRQAGKTTLALDIARTRPSL